MITLNPLSWLASYVRSTKTAQALCFFDELFRLSHAIQKDPLDTHRMICAYYGTDGVDVERLEYLRHVAERGETLPWEADRDHQRP